jgi:hypothetical protein
MSTSDQTSELSLVNAAQIFFESVTFVQICLHCNVDIALPSAILFDDRWRTHCERSRWHNGVIQHHSISRNYGTGTDDCSVKHD